MHWLFVIYKLKLLQFMHNCTISPLQQRRHVVSQSALCSLYAERLSSTIFRRWGAGGMEGRESQTGEKDASFNLHHTSPRLRWAPYTGRGRKVQYKEEKSGARGVGRIVATRVARFELFEAPPKIWPFYKLVGLENFENF